MAKSSTGWSRSATSNTLSKASKYPRSECLTSSSSFGAENPNSRRRESSQTRSITQSDSNHLTYGIIKYQNLTRGHVGSVLLQSAARIITSQISPICAAARARI